MKRIIAFAAVLCAGVLFAEDEIERLEFIETDGTQWADTGVKLHCRNSMFRLRVRILDYATSTTVLFGGMTEVKDSASGNWKSFAVGTKPTGNVASDKSLISWNEGSDSNGYFYPTTGKFTQYGGFTLEGWRHRAWYNGSKTGHEPYESNKPNVTTANSFYLGACNNAGDGVIGAHPEEKVRIHWYRAEFWNNITNSDDRSTAELIGDFIPVRKGGVVGFYDLVTKTFHPSISGVAFQAPERVLWQGGNDGALTDDANWEGGQTPDKFTQVAEFPAGVQLGYPTEDINGFFSKVGGVRLDGADTLLWLTNLNVAGEHTLLAPLFGTAGTFRVESKLNASSQWLKLRSDNSAFGGLFDITNCYTYYCAPYSLGEAGVGKASYYANFGNIRLYSNCTFLHADLMLGKTGQFVFAPGSILDGKVSMTAEDSGASFHANTSDTTTFAGEFDDPLLTRRTLELTAGYYVFKDATKPKFMGKVQVKAPNLTLNAPLAFERQANNATIFNQCNLSMGEGGSKGLVFGCTNALSDETFLLLGYAKNVTALPKNIVDLNGFDQHVGILGLYTGGFNSTTDWNTNLVITSKAPATLTVLEAYRCDANDGTDYNCSVFPGLVRGAASIVLSEKEMINATLWSKRMRFNAPGSDTTGSLTAKGGYVEIMPTATFSNLTALAASKTGVVKVKTPDVGNATNLFVSVTDATTAKIEIAEDVTLVADTALMGERWLDEGDYTKADLPKYIAGEGTLHVNRYGGPRGLMILLR